MDNVYVYVGLLQEPVARSMCCDKKSQELVTIHTLTSIVPGGIHGVVEFKCAW